jgi:hypothetical protein
MRSVPEPSEALTKLLKLLPHAARADRCSSGDRRYRLPGNGVSGGKPLTVHGPLQRLLDRSCLTSSLS